MMGTLKENVHSTSLDAIMRVGYDPDCRTAMSYLAFVGKVEKPATGQRRCQRMIRRIRKSIGRYDPAPVHN